MHYQLHANTHAAATITVPDATGPEPIEFHRLMPGYAETPLLETPAIARALGVRRVLVKDESTRMGLPSFKMLGASWATASAVCREWLGDPSEVLAPAEIAARIPAPQSRRLVAATDGNHGRGVARMAKLLGIACTIYVPKGTAASRIADIESEGAVVHVVDGSYDDAIAVSARDANENTLVVSDTSWDGYAEIPRSVSRGYSTMFREIDAALDRAGISSPTTIALQAGVGSFAAAALSHYRDGHLQSAPRSIIVEPVSANCLLRSAETGELAEAPGPHNSTMAGLNCGLPSQLAWPILQRGTDLFLAIEDDAPEAAMRLYADSGIIAGESGAAGLGALLALVKAGDAEDIAAAGLGPEATVLFVNTEWATDPVNYERVVGQAPASVESGKADRRSAAGVVAL
jgi:diaminopropionate ammonia-lyase